MSLGNTVLLHLHISVPWMGISSSLVVQNQPFYLLHVFRVPSLLHLNLPPCKWYTKFASLQVLKQTFSQLNWWLLLSVYYQTFSWRLLIRVSNHNASTLNNSSISKSQTKLIHSCCLSHIFISKQSICYLPSKLPFLLPLEVTL